jgi:hypothetical protein
MNAHASIMILARTRGIVRERVVMVPAETVLANAKRLSAGKGVLRMRVFDHPKQGHADQVGDLDLRRSW